MRPTFAATCLLILVLSTPTAAQDRDAARLYATRAADAADAIPDPARRLAVYRDLLPVLGRAKAADAITRVADAATKLAQDRRDRPLRAEIAAAASTAYALAGDRDRHESWMYQAIDAGAFGDRRVAWPALARARLAGGDAEGAAQLATALATPAERATCLAELATLAAKSGDRATCYDLLRLATGHARSAGQTAEPLGRIAEAQVLLGDRAGAENTAIGMPPGYWRARAMGAVAGSVLKVGNAERYKTMIADAERSALKEPGPVGRATALLAVARLSAEAGDPAGAKETIAATAPLLKDVPADQLGGFHLALAGVLAQANDPAAAEAMKKAAESFKGIRQSFAAEDVVASLVNVNDPAAATPTAMMIDHPAVRARAMAKVAEGLAANQQWPELAAVLRDLDAEGWQAARTIGQAHAKAGKAKDLDPLLAETPDPILQSALLAGLAEGSK